MITAAAATVASILDAAERITQAVGYNGLSFRDLAAAVGIKSASVHYHFPTKAQLGAAVARRYTDRLIFLLEEVEARDRDPKNAFAAYVDVFRATLEQDGRMCLCGMLAAETDAIPPEVRAEVCRFVGLNVRWISSVIERVAVSAATTGSVRKQATAIFAALEGAMLVTRSTGDIATFDAIVAQLGSVGLIPY